MRAWCALRSASSARYCATLQRSLPVRARRKSRSPSGDGGSRMVASVGMANRRFSICEPPKANARGRYCPATGGRRAAGAHRKGVLEVQADQVDHALHVASSRSVRRWEVPKNSAICTIPLAPSVRMASGFRIPMMPVGKPVVERAREERPVVVGRQRNDSHGLGHSADSSPGGTFGGGADSSSSSAAAGRAVTATTASTSSRLRPASFADVREGVRESVGQAPGGSSGRRRAPRRA